jgi:hypothetical protein
MADFTEPEGIGNDASLYYGLYRVAKAKYDSDRPGDMEKAFELCEKLRLYPNLPLMVLARVHMVLSTKNNEDGTQSAYSLEHANTAIRILDEEVRSLVRSNEHFPQETYDEAVRIRDLLLQETAELKAAAGPAVIDPGTEDVEDDDDQHLTIPTTLAATLTKTLGKGKKGLRTPVASRTPTGQTEPMAPPSVVQKRSLMSPESPEHKRKKQVVGDSESDQEEEEVDE